MKTIEDYNVGDLIETSEGIVRVSEFEGVTFYANTNFNFDEDIKVDFTEDPSDLDEDKFEN